MKKLLICTLLVGFRLMGQYTWAPLPNVAVNTNGQRFDDVFFLNANVGWAANGYYAAVYKTIDGGDNWTLQTNNTVLGSNHYFRNIEFLDENIGFLGTLNGKFYRTTNGGTSWDLVTINPNPQAICGLDCVGPSTVYGCGAYFFPAYIIKSTDSGQTWEYIDMSAYADALVEVLFLDENTGFAAGNNATGAVVLKTVDGGQTWSTLYNGTISGEYVWKLQVLTGNPNIIFGAVEAAAPNNGTLIKSVDGGQTWVVKNAPEPEIQAVGFVDENTGWMGGHATGFYQTTDGGDTWVNTTVGSNLNRIFIMSPTLAYACGTTIYKMTPSMAVPQFTEQPRKPLQVTIAPMPITNKLQIEITFLGVDHLNLGLYDQQGKRITTLLIDEINGAGKKEYSFDFPYADGVYYLNLHTNTGRQSVKIVK